jgi:hypothetical protein
MTVHSVQTTPGPHHLPPLIVLLLAGLQAGWLTTQLKYPSGIRLADDLTLIEIRFNHC